MDTNAPQLQITVVLRPKAGLSVIESNTQLLKALTTLEGWTVAGMNMGERKVQDKQVELPPRLAARKD